jgi:predicted PurR-regulated permease PerM
VILVLLYFLYLISDILIILFVSLIFASAFDPTVDWLAKRKIPRTVGILLIYLVLFTLVSLIIYLIIPPITQEVTELSQNFPYYFEKIISVFSKLREYSFEHGILDNIKNGLSSLTANLPNAAGGVFSTLTGIFGGIVSFVLILVLTFYMVVEENAMKKLIWSIAPPKHQAYLMLLISRMQKKIGLWLRGQLILCLIIFILDYLGLLILNVKYALVLALIAGLTEFVPYFGPIIGAIPAVFLAFFQSPALALFVAALYYIVQLVENHILVPKIMQKAVGLNPIISIVALLVGFKVAGVIGAILSIPVVTAISVFIKDIFDSKDAEKIV